MHDSIAHFVYWYIIRIHPIYYLYTKAMEYNPDNMDMGVWLAIATFGIVAWFGLARFLAETPGRMYGNMYFWWIIIGTLHIWSLPIFGVYVLIASGLRRHWQTVKGQKFDDRSRKDIYSGAWDEKREMQKRKHRR